MYMAAKEADENRDWQEDMMASSQQYLSEMFPFSQDVTNFAQDLYGGGGFSSIEDYLTNPTKPSNLQRQLFEFFGGQIPPKGRGNQHRMWTNRGAPESGPLAGLGPEMLSEATGYLESLIPHAQKWGETGFKTDIKPIQDYAMRMFDYMIAEVDEKHGRPRKGSGWDVAMNREMGDVSSELGAMEVALNEAAAGRRMQGLSGPIQNIFTDPLNTTAQFATAAGQAGQMYQQAIDNARPGKGLLGALQMFANIDQGQGFIQGGFPTSGTDAGNMWSALGQTASGAAGGLGDLFSNILDNWGSGGNTWGGSEYELGAGNTGTNLFSFQGDPLAGMGTGEYGGDAPSSFQFGDW